MIGEDRKGLIIEKERGSGFVSPKITSSHAIIAVGREAVPERE
jgi:hypothetical protein